MDETMDKQMALLEALLGEQLGLYEQVMTLLHAKRRALAAADHKQVTALCGQENQRLQAIAEVEKRRLVLVGEMTLALAPDARAPMRMAELAERLPEPARGRLLALRQQVRERMAQIQAEVGVARRATERLVRHMHGLIQTIGSAVTGVAIYNRAGGRPKAVASMSTFNMTA